LSAGQHSSSFSRTSSKPSGSPATSRRKGPEALMGGGGGGAAVQSQTTSGSRQSMVLMNVSNRSGDSVSPQ